MYKKLKKKYGILNMNKDRNVVIFYTKDKNLLKKSLIFHLS